ncbi:MAG: sugar ABC transporter permease [Bacillota bacterium]
MRTTSHEHRRRVIWGYIFLAPALALFALIVVWPFLYALWLGFFDWPVFGEKTFVGLGNYVRMLSDDLLRKSLVNTVYWTCCVVPAIVIVSLALALLLEAKFLKARAFFRTVYFVPVITSMVAAAFTWKWMFEPTFGVVNWILRAVGIRGPGWLASTTWALPAMMAVGIWKQVGFALVIFLAGLQTIPRELKEAAIVDGAGPAQLFSKVILPLLNPTVVLVMVMLVINAFRVFTIPYVMSAGGFTWATPGGPLNSTRVLVLHIYDLAFSKFDVGYASATAFVLLAIIMLVTIIQMKLVQRPFEY